MRSIMVLNSKGGSGKSTISINLAVCYASLGKKGILADLDLQSSSLEWLTGRASGKKQITGVDASNGHFRALRSADYIIYDTPAAIPAKDITAYLRRAQSIIIPDLPPPIDMRVATPFIQKVLANGRVVRKESRVALISNRCRENTNVYHQLGDYLKKIRKAPFISVLRETQNYNKASERGQGIFELPPYLVTRDLDQWEPVIKWLGSKRSQSIN